jgi:UDP-sugar transporter A1/2/3
LSSGFAAVYTEKVIKRVGTTQQTATAPPVSGLAYTQIQLAMTSLVIEGGWAFATDGAAIRERGLWDGFDYKACISVFNSAAGGLTVAAVLKYADAVLKGYATAVSVVLTGLLSMLFFGTTLSVEYALGMVNVFAAIVLYNVRDLDAHAW